MYGHRFNELAAVGIVRDGDRIIIIKRKTSPRDPWSGQIALPGGHIEQGESVTEGLLREIREEVNLNLLPDSIKGQMESVGTAVAPELCVFPFVLDYQNIETAYAGPEVSELKIVKVQEFRETVTANGLPAMDYDGWQVWGMTYRILMQYIQGNFKVYRK